MHETARAYLFLGMHDKAEPLCRASLEIARRLSAKRIQAEALATLAVFRTFPLDDEIAMLKEAIEISQSEGLLFEEGRARFNLAWPYFANKGEIRLAQEQYTKCAQIDRQMGDLTGELINLCSVAWLSCLMGRLSEAKETLEYVDQQSLKLEEIGIRLRKWKLLARGGLQYASGELLYAEQSHHAQLSAASEGELWLDFTSAARELSLDLISLGRLQEAETILSEAIPVADKYIDWSRVVLRGIQSIVYAKQGKLSLSQNILGEGDSLESQRKSVWYKLMLDWARAWVLASTSSYREAFEVFKNTINGMAKVELRTYQLVVVRDWADVYLARGEPGDLDRARELLTEALTEYQNMGADGWVKLVKARLAELGG